MTELDDLIYELMDFNMGLHSSHDQVQALSKIKDKCRSLNINNQMKQYRLRKLLINDKTSLP